MVPEGNRPVARKKFEQALEVSSDNESAVSTFMATTLSGTNLVESVPSERYLLHRNESLRSHQSLS
jgi:hypothetical protein